MELEKWGDEGGWKMEIGILPLREEKREREESNHVDLENLRELLLSSSLRGPIPVDFDREAREEE